MTYRKKNLLEAFQASAAAEKAKASAGPSPRVGGPFAPEAQHKPSEPPAAPRPSPAAQLATSQLARLIALQLVITVAAFFLGRASVSSVDAGAPHGAAAGAEPVSKGTPRSPDTSGSSAAAGGSKPAVEVDTQPGTAAERALLDPRNRYTVKVVEYRKGVDDALAAETLAWLQQNGLPAAAQFRGSRLYILVGAAASSSELTELRDRARAIDGPPPLHKKTEFHDAYVEQIDKLIDR